ncbi:B12-binding domain-containing protein [Planctobacterium marinum]|uniref:B12-binding N-terminal domain-containing protein n=1 Tax=Planctobacterium marinum TaxID=1631968 RepID=A0AA48I3A1_9ALTE|nr:hypothetical protein MACH26_06510 [Planctobacterium marinum]
MTQDIALHRLAWNDALSEMDKYRAHDVAQNAIKELGIEVFGDEILTPSLEKTGSEWETGASSLAEVYMAGKIAAEILSTHAPLGIGQCVPE